MDRTEEPLGVARSGSRDAMLIESGLALASELSLSAVLQRIVDLAAELTGARYGALGVLSAQGSIDRFITTGIREAQQAAIGAPPVGEGILGMLAGADGPLRIRDMVEDPRSAGFPANHPEMHSFLGLAIRNRGRVFGNIYLTEKQGAPEFDEDDERALEVLAAQAAVAIENARLYEESHRRERWLEAVREVSNAILAGVDIEEVLGLIARRARELIGADLATIATPLGADMLTLAVADGKDADQLRGLEFPLRASISGDVIRSGEPQIVQDVSSDPRTAQPVVSAGMIGPSVVVPLSMRGSAYGTLLVGNDRGGKALTDADLRLVETFAGQAAVALEYARAQQEVQRLIVMEDRERIAKELHDGAIQSLFAVGMGLEGIASMSGNEEIAQRLENAAADVDRVIRDLRNYIFGLRPGILADRQLDQALRELAHDFQDRSGVTTAVDIDADIASELASKASDLVQLTREALSNIGRHANAETCRVSLRREDEVAVLEIDDDGDGFEMSHARPEGNGLRNIRERAEALGGEASIESARSEGTTIRVVLPL